MLFVYSNVNKDKVVKQLEKRKKRLQRKVARKYQANKQGTIFVKTSNIKKLEQQIRLIDRRLKNIRDTHIHNMTKVGIMAVKGNCDFDNVEDELIFDIEDKVIFLCHGDKYNVKYGLDEIEAKAKSIDADIVIFGHTHTPLNFKKDNIIYLNPGSVSLPRGVDYKSFSIMNLENDNIKIEQIRL